MLPFWLLFYTVRLFQIVGYVYFAVLFMMYFLYKYNNYYNGTLAESKHDITKMQDKRLIMTQEAFENIRTIKFFGWDNLFSERIKKIHA